jgi:PAS domain S-box-containing protein
MQQARSPLKTMSGSGPEAIGSDFRESRHGLRAVAAAAVATILVAVAGLAASVYFSHATAIETRLAEEERNIVALGRYVRGQYESMERALDTVEDLLDRTEPTVTDIDALLAIKTRVDRQFSAAGIEINIWRPDGAIATEKAGLNVADREPFASHFEPPREADPRKVAKTGSVIAAPVQGRMRDFRLIPVSRAYRDGGGRIRAILTATLPEENFVELFDMLRHAPNDAIFLFRNDHVGIVRAPFDARFSGRALPDALVFQNYPARTKGRFEGPAATDGVKRIGVHYGLAPLPLVLGISFEVTPLSWRSIEPHAPFIALGFLVLVAASGFALLAFVTIRKAAERAELSATQRDAAIVSAQRLRAVLASAHDGIITLDENLQITAVNRAAEAIFGAREADLAGGPLDPLLPAAMRLRHASLMQDMAQAPDVSRAMSNWRAVKGLHASGREFPAMVSISKVTVLGSPMYLAVVRDMTDILANEEHLAEVASEQERLRELAEQATLAKSKFLATMSHELRTPLNAIIGFSESIDMGIAGPADSPRYREYIQLILAAGRHLLSLINDILDLSRIQGGAALRDVQPVDLRATMIEAAQVLRARIETKKIEIVEHLEDEVEFATDPRAILQVLINIIGNAVKFSPAGGRITLRAVRTDGGGGMLEVRDEGPGIPPDVMRRIGQPFVQARSDLVSDNEGAGLGLAITMELLKLMGGRLTLRNVEPTGLQARIDFDPPVVAAGPTKISGAGASVP